MAWIIRILMFIAAPLAALFVARDSLKFDIVQTMIALLLVVGALIVMAVWPKRRDPS